MPHQHVALGVLTEQMTVAHMSRVYHPHSHLPVAVSSEDTQTAFKNYVKNVLNSKRIPPNPYRSKGLYWAGLSDVDVV